MNARALANALLEADEDYIGDPMTYAFDTASKDTWLVPHPWVHALRGLGFKLKHNEYTPRLDKNPKKIEFWSAERAVQLKSGELLKLQASGYDQPELKDHVGLSISYKGTRSDEGGIYSTKPLSPVQLKPVLRDIIRRLERTEVEYDWNSYTRGVQETVNKVLKTYEYWENNRD